MRIHLSSRFWISSSLLEKKNKVSEWLRLEEKTKWTIQLKILFFSNLFYMRAKFFDCDLKLSEVSRLVNFLFVQEPHKNISEVFSSAKTYSFLLLNIRIQTCSSYEWVSLRTHLIIIRKIHCKNLTEEKKNKMQSNKKILKIVKYEIKL